MIRQPFLQIHTLTSYPASLLNRDDVGLAKRIPFGGVIRTRVSSQCLKRHWRTAQGIDSLAALAREEGVSMSLRSRITFQKFLLDRMMAEGIDEEVAVLVVEEIKKLVLGGEKADSGGKETDDGEEEAADEKKGKKSKKSKKKVSCATKQVTVLGRAEMDFLFTEAMSLAKKVDDVPKDKDKDKAKAFANVVKTHFSKSNRDNLKAIDAGLDGALFGRMVTGDLLARTDAPIHVAHAFTVHEEMTESDYFSVVDDLLGESDSAAKGSGHIGSTELTSGLFYGYVAVDLPLLVSNLTGISLDGEGRRGWAEHYNPMTSEVLRRLIRLIATVSPGAKLGSTAPHSYASLVLVERGATQPRSLANAFLKPVRPGHDGDLLRNAYRRLGRHVGDLDQMYGDGPERRFAALGPAEALGLTFERGSLDEVIAWATGG